MPILTSYSSGISLLPHFPRNCAAASRSSKLGLWLRRVFKPLKICIKKQHVIRTSEKNINYCNVNLIFPSSFLPFTNCSRFEKLPLNSAERRGSILLKF